MLSTLYRLSHFNLTVTLADTTILSVSQISTEMLSNLPKFTKMVISGSRVCNPHQLQVHALKPEQRSLW